MQLSSGEKAIWAAEFVKNYDVYNKPAWVYRETEEEQERWELNQVAMAVERAGYAVLYARQVQSQIAEGFGEDDEIYSMLVDMLN